MVTSGVAEGPVRLIGCAPIYKIPQTRWTTRLTVQMTMYVLFIGMSMAAGGLMPWLLELFHGWKVGAGNSLYKMYSQDQGYIYDNSNTYAFCPKQIRFSYDPLQRGYPAAPLAPKNGRLYDAWYHKKVVLKGVSWFGFNNKQGMVDGLWAGGSSAATDFQAVVYELKLLGFNTVRLPFTFDMLKSRGLNQVQKCTSSTKSSWAKRATDPDIQPQPEYAGVPNPPVYLDVPVTSRHLCNTYLPSNNTASIERLMWTVQNLVANGFYVVLDYHPDPTDTLALDVETFARAWTYTWAAVACLPNFASDIRGRLLLDLLNEPDKIGTAGLGWTRSGTVPGLDELYLTTMDTIESITPNDALFMVQGSVLSQATDRGARDNKFGLSAGDGFVTNTATMSKYDLTDPRGFFNELLKRPYKNRLLLAPHLYGPSVSGVAAAAAFDVAAKVDSSWGVLATDGYCNGNECMRLPVVAGEMGSQLQTQDDLAYYDGIAQYVQLGIAGDGSESPLVGWIWWAYNANSAGTGGLTTDDWQDLLWPKIRYLVDYYGLKPWYENPAAFIKNIEAEKNDALMARAAADAAAHSAAGAADQSPLNLTGLPVVRFGAKPSADAAAAGAGAAADTTVGGQLEVPATVEYIPAEASAAAPAAAAAVPDQAPATPATQPVAGLTPKVVPAPVAATRVQPVPAPAAATPAAAAVAQQVTAPSAAVTAASAPNVAPAAVQVTQPPTVPVAAPGWLPATAGSKQLNPASKPSELVAAHETDAASLQESLAALEADSAVPAPSAKSDEGLKEGGPAASVRSLLAESQLPAMPEVKGLQQQEVQQTPAVSAAEKAMAAAAQAQASRHIAAATKLLVQSGNGASY